MTWNEDIQAIEAGLGGKVTRGEAEVLAEDLLAFIEELPSVSRVDLDITRVTAYGPGARETLETLHFRLGATPAWLNLIENDEPSVEMCAKVRAILAGQEMTSATAQRAG